MRVTNILLAGGALLLAMSSGIQADSAGSGPSDRYAYEIGALCGVDMARPESLGFVKRQPAFFWAAGQFSFAGLSPSDVAALRPAVSCSGQSIVVDEVRAGELVRLARERKAKAL